MYHVCNFPAQNVIRQGECKQPVHYGGSNHALDRCHRQREAIRRAQRLLVGDYRRNVHVYGT